MSKPIESSELRIAGSRPTLDGPERLPGSAVRFEKVLTRVDAGLSRLDGFIETFLPAELNPLAQSGRAANFALIQAVISGILMLLWYSPSVQFAYTSLESIQGQTLGGMVRAAHRYSSDLLMLFLFIHAGRMFFSRKFSGARWLPWVSGIGLMALIWFIGWTGYWLVWDQPAQQVAVTSVNLLDVLPVFGDPLSRSFLANRLVPSLLFFVIFFMHMLLPLGIAVGLVIHLLRLSRVKLLPGWRLGVAMTAGLLLAAWMIPAPLDQAADMAVKAEHFTVDAWYLTPLALGLRFQQGGLWLAIGGTLAAGAAIPWLLGRRRQPASYQALVDIPRCHSCSQCVNDCPFDAISLVPRTDGKGFPSQAWVDPAKCVGCGVCGGSCDSAGIGLTWFNNLLEEGRIRQTFTAGLTAGGPPWIALVAGDIDGGLASLDAGKWNKRLAGYQVFTVPTASWIRSSFVERLLKDKARGVLIIRDRRMESPARGGNQWVQDRLEGIRGPVFRPERAGGNSNWQILDYNAADPEGTARAARAFQSGAEPDSFPRERGIFRCVLATAVLAAGLGVAAIAPSHLVVSNPAPSNPELVFSFKVFGDLMDPVEVNAEEDLSKPIHMRGRSTEKPHRSPVTVSVRIDGVEDERTFEARGISSDGPALGDWREPIDEGPHSVAIEIRTGNDSLPLRWEGEIQARPRRLNVITYSDRDGFRLE